MLVIRHPRVRLEGYDLLPLWEALLLGDKDRNIISGSGAQPSPSSHTGHQLLQVEHRARITSGMYRKKINHF